MINFPTNTSLLQWSHITLFKHSLLFLVLPFRHFPRRSGELRSSYIGSINPTIHSGIPCLCLYLSGSVLKPHCCYSHVINESLYVRIKKKKIFFEKLHFWEYIPTLIDNVLFQILENIK